MGKHEHAERQPDPPDLGRHTFRSGTVLLAAEGFEFVLRLASIAWLARLLGPGDFGLVAMVTAVFALAYGARDLGLAMATIQREEISHAQVSALFWVNATLGLGLMLLSALLAIPVSQFYSDPRLTLITIVIGSGFFWSGISVQHQALLRRQMRFGQLASIQVVSSALSVATAVFLAMEGYGYWALVAREVSRALFMAIGSWICMPWLPSRPARADGLSSMLKFGGDLTAFNFVHHLSSSLDQILIGRFFGATSLGLYRQGVNLVLNPIGQLLFPINTVAESALSRLQSDPARYRRYYIKILEMLSSIAMPVAVLLGVLAGEIVGVVLDSKWEAAADFFRILAVVSVIKPVASTAGFVLVTCGKTRKYLWWGIANAVALVGCLFVGSNWGPKGVAIGHVAAAYLFLVPSLGWAFAGTPVHLSDFFRALARPFAASVALAAAIYGMKVTGMIYPSLASLAAAGYVGAVAYVATFALLPGGQDVIRRVADEVRSLVGARPRGAPGANDSDSKIGSEITP